MARRHDLMPVAPSILRTFKAFDDWLNMPRPFRAFDDLLNMPRFWSSGTAVDAYETDKEFVVKMDVPGWRKEDLKIRVEDNTVYITGNREETTEVEEKNYYRHERYAERIHEVIPIPVAVDPNKTKAKMADGVLEVTIPKTDRKNSGVQVDIK